MSKEAANLVEVTIVNHVSAEIDCVAETVWSFVQEQYGKGHKFRSLGYSISALSAHPSAYLGGYEMISNPPGEDNRICRITEFDPENMTMSIRADYLSPAANGMIVYATYRVRKVGTQVRLDIDSHTAANIASVENGDGEAVFADTMKTITEQFYKAMRTYLDEAKRQLKSS
ncbi:MAG: hypothetical protein R3E04_10710 [Sphingobium sp.]